MYAKEVGREVCWKDEGREFGNESICMGEGRVEEDGYVTSESRYIADGLNVASDIVR